MPESPPPYQPLPQEPTDSFDVTDSESHAPVLPPPQNSPPLLGPSISEDDEEDLSMSLMGATKRRAAYPPLPPKPQMPPSPLPLPPTLSFVAGRRRRLFAYLAAFATMLALSSMLDLRRAALNARQNNRITLSLPNAATPPTDDEQHADAVPPPDHHPPPADGAALAEETAAEEHRKKPPPKHDTTASVSAQKQPVTSNSEDTPTTPGSKLTDQELKDGVDQLISHVDQENENAKSNTTTTVDATHLSSNDDADISAPGSNVLSPSQSNSNSASSSTTTDHHHKANAPHEPTPHAKVPSPPASALRGNDTATEGETIEEQFTAAQSAMEALSNNNTLKELLESRAQEIRTLKALGLQAARGDCEKASDSATGSLFKTDAEASGGDIERSDPLWGAWCVFSGRYKSEAMHDYVARTHAFRIALHAAAADSTPAEPSRFDDTAATLNDVLTADAQTLLRDKATRILPHLSDADARLLAALALQATLGDCGPYAKVAPQRPPPDSTDNEKPPRELVDPLFGKKAERGEGALWGAWCVFARRKRATAAAQLSERIDRFWRQLNDAAAVNDKQPVR